tara:strand:+ start:506 stop:1351 length:846 start_codon:yes stop_codon:yes gene_type:complete
MKFSLFREHGAQNSKPVFDAFADSLRSNGHVVVDNSYDCDVGVIWSVLWNGRMAPNKKIWEDFHNLNKKVIVLEVGGLVRGKTWKVAIDGINRDANFGNGGNDSTRANQLGLKLKPWSLGGDRIIICGQHDKSNQWKDMPTMSTWLLDTIRQIRERTDMPIVWRPHPRCPVPGIEHEYKNVRREQPIQVKDTYDDFDFDCTGAYAVVNWSSNPATHAVMQGVPVFVGPSSLAYDVGNKDFTTIGMPKRPDRTQWLNDIAHTEWTLEEIAEGKPLNRLTSYL